MSSKWLQNTKLNSLDVNLVAPGCGWSCINQVVYYFVRT